MPPANVDELIEGLQHARSPKRRSAARMLRKLGAKEAGPALLDALEREVQRRVTWETQYQMAMALGTCDYKPSIPRLRAFLNEDITGTMFLSALAHALVLLERESINDSTPVLRFVEEENHWLVVDGALAAAALTQAKYDDDSVQRILRRVLVFHEKHWYWTAVACAGWRGAWVDSFLDRCAFSSNEWTREAAEKAKVGIYIRNSIL